MYSPNPTDPTEATGQTLLCRVITTADLGVDLADLQRTLAPTWARLPPDPYDARRTRIELLRKVGPDDDAFWDWVERYFASGANLHQMQARIDALPPDARTAFDSARPFRQRAVARYDARHDPAEGWIITQQQHQDFSQLGDNQRDLRNLPRRFAPIGPDVTDSDTWRGLLAGAASLVAAEHRNRPTALRIVTHLVELTADASGATSAPEGRHQDGSNAIVSAIVVGLDNASGAESVVYLGQDGPEVLRHCLQPGEGVLQEDRNSILWHTVTPLTPADPTRLARRRTIGFDFDFDFDQTDA